MKTELKRETDEHKNRKSKNRFICMNYIKLRIFYQPASARFCRVEPFLMAIMCRHFHTQSSVAWLFAVVHCDSPLDQDSTDDKPEDRRIRIRTLISPNTAQILGAVPGLTLLAVAVAVYLYGVRRVSAFVTSSRVTSSRQDGGRGHRTLRCASDMSSRGRPNGLL